MYWEPSINFGGLLSPVKSGGLQMKDWTKVDIDELSGAAIVVHKVPRAGLLELAYKHFY